MAFQIGDKVVYPNHGIGVVEDIDSAKVAEEPEDFYKLRILANSTVVLPKEMLDGAEPVFGEFSVHPAMTPNSGVLFTFDFMSQRQVKAFRDRAPALRRLLEIALPVLRWEGVRRQSTKISSGGS